VKVRDLIELLSEEDGERNVVVPWVVAGVARECVGIREVDMDLDSETGDYTASGSKRVIALLPASRKPDKKKEGTDGPDKKEG
jgi:hypothetical protein